jgi:hypothetical protein
LVLGDLIEDEKLHANTFETECFGTESWNNMR